MKIIMYRLGCGTRNSGDLPLYEPSVSSQDGGEGRREWAITQKRKKNIR